VVQRISRKERILRYFEVSLGILCSFWGIALIVTGIIPLLAIIGYPLSPDMGIMFGIISTFLIVVSGFIVLIYGLKKIFLALVIPKEKELN